MAMKLGRTQVRVSARAQPSRPTPPASAVKSGKWKEATLAGTIAAAVPVFPAMAADGVDDAIESVIGAVKTTGDVLKSTISAVDSGVQIIKQGYDVASPYIDSTVKAVSPVVESAIKVTGEVASPALKAASPALSDAQEAISSTLSSSGISTVVSASSKAITAATPVAKSFANFVSTTDPVLLAEYAVGAAALVYLGPPVLGAVGGLFRGYAGEISAAQVLDYLNDGNTVLIDIRSTKEKESSGVPDVPASASRRSIEVEFAVTEDKKLRNSLRNPNGIEAVVTGLQIASLKAVNKGTKIILLDRYGGASVAVAKELASKGFGKVYTVTGGFDGRGGWVQSKLQIKPAATVLSAPAPATKTIGTFGKRALPAPKA